MVSWRKIKNYPRYKVSSDGDIKSLKTGDIMKPFIANNGYLTVKLYDGIKHHPKAIHRLVAETFYDGDHEGLEVNHIDGNKLNNSIENLEWCSHSANTRHAIENGLFTPYKLPPYSRPGIRVRIIETGEEFSSLTDCAKRVGGVIQGVCQCLNGTKKTYKGYHYEQI